MNFAFADPMRDFVDEKAATIAGVRAPHPVKVSFDFDGTLSRPIVQAFAREVIEAGAEAWIVTMRYASAEAAAEEHARNPESEGALVPNDDLFEVAARLGIPRDRIVFTNWDWKSAAIAREAFVFHLDDCPDTLRHIQAHCRTRAISAHRTTSWRRKCLRLLEGITTSSTSENERA